MSDPVANVDVEDVLSSIRKLVSSGEDDLRPAPKPQVADSDSSEDDTDAETDAADPETPDADATPETGRDALILTSALRVHDPATEPEAQDVEPEETFAVLTNLRTAIADEDEEDEDEIDVPFISERSGDGEGAADASDGLSVEDNEARLHLDVPEEEYYEDQDETIVVSSLEDAAEEETAELEATPHDEETSDELSEEDLAAWTDGQPSAEELAETADSDDADQPEDGDAAHVEEEDERAPEIELMDDVSEDDAADTTAEVAETADDLVDDVAEAAEDIAEDDADVDLMDADGSDADHVEDGAEDDSEELESVTAASPAEAPLAEIYTFMHRDSGKVKAEIMDSEAAEVALLGADDAEGGATDAEVDTETAGQVALPEVPEDESETAGFTPFDESLIDEDVLRDLVSDIVRQELSGALGERITRNVRKLVRREIHKALMTKDLD